MPILQKISYRKEARKIKKSRKGKPSEKKIAEVFEEAYILLCKEMDKRDKFFRKLEEWMQKTGKIPEKYIGDWAAYLTDGRYLREYWDKNKSWKDVRMVHKTIIMTARVTTINKLNGEEK